MEETTPTAVPASPAGDNMPIIVLSWIFAPLVSLFFLNHTDSEVKWHAKQSMYFGLVDIGIQIAFWVLNFVLSLTIVLFPLAACLSLFSFAWAIISLVVRVYGAVQGYQGKRWEVPVISKYVK